MTWKEAFKEVKEEMDIVLPDGSRIEIIYPAIIMGLSAILLLIFVA